MKYILGLLIIAVIVIAIGASVRGTIAEPATSTTAVAATTALGTAVVIQQMTMCVIPLAVLVVIGLGIVAWMMWRKEHAQVNEQHEIDALARRVQIKDEQINSPVRTVRAYRRKTNYAARNAERMFK